MPTKDILERFSSITELPCLEILEGVIFPGDTGVIEVDRPENINAISYADHYQLKDKFILCVGRYEDGSWHDFGVVARIINILTFNDARIKIMLQPIIRVKLDMPYRSRDNTCWLTIVSIDSFKDVPNKRLQTILKKTWTSYINSAKAKVPGAEDKFPKITGVEDLAYRMASYLMSLTVEERENLINTPVTEELIQQVIIFIDREKEFYILDNHLNESVREEIAKDNRDFALDKKMKLLQKEMGNNINQDVVDLVEKLAALPLSENNRKKVDAEIKKLEHTHQSSPEYSLAMHYLNWVIDIPWDNIKSTESSLASAKKILDRDHYGLEKTKERILEAIAVQLHTKKMFGSILCLMGPPGVGKTSVGQSIADATGRSYVRIALGGVKDEAEIRGHRRTYIGAMPGKIVKALKIAENSNPCILLDEIDKMSADFRGDPSSALLEVLDPEQNFRFNDHFMDMDIDLSKVLFIATANSYNIPTPLLDRMEIIDLSGYTELEKIAIAQKYLLPKSMRKHGITNKELKLQKAALQSIIRLYTRESGVRELERMIDKLARKRVREILEEKDFEVTITSKLLLKYLGSEVYNEELVLKKPTIGVVQGLAWTSCGGAMLSVEAVALPGRGKLLHTGSLGDVMQESIQASITLSRKVASEYSCDPDYYEGIDLHVHLPEGATPKDGPSAGITLCTALVSMMTNIPVKQTVAMTGEINLRGEVLAIGGLKEKLLAALQAKITDVLIPKENVKDLEEIPAEVKEGLNIHPVESISEVLSLALTKKLTKSVWPKKKKQKKESKS